MTRAMMTGIGACGVVGILAIGAAAQLGGCSSSSSSSDDCTAGCNKLQASGCPGAASGTDGGPDCVTRCKNRTFLSSSCPAQVDLYVHCIATKGTISCSDAGQTTMTGCDTELAAAFTCPSDAGSTE